MTDWKLARLFLSVALPKDDNGRQGGVWRFKYQDIPHGDVVMYISIIPSILRGRHHATTKETICKDCEKLKKEIAFRRDLAGRYKALCGRLREARVARPDRT
jgi:hypothetical protein